MRLSRLLRTLDEISPFELQEEWDNSGLIVGDPDREISQVYVGLDVDDRVLDEVEEGSALIVHHPLIFKGLRMLDFRLFPSRLIREAIRKEISIVAMHTNFDKSHLNRYVATQILGYEEILCEGYLCSFEVNKPFLEFAEEIRQRLGLKVLKTVETKAYIQRAALCTGSGADLMAMVKDDCLLTGDIKYHQAMEAKLNGLAMVDIGHFESERFFGEILQKELKNYNIHAIMAHSQNPFTYM
ncbi:MAG: Nif3-like dinuclear metal center hexameric protein [Campylobacteraceae bacterium 4484_4]|nr:MAG: Nif3-like dinuclear metal center hexameric protein [Campylobacteraceae bacterium 4484_4]